MNKILKLDIANLTDGFPERFWKKVEKTDGCWIWKSRTDKYGYGVCRMRRRDILAHRMAFLLSNGKLDGNLLILHSCDNPFCVRPEHLRQGTVTDNYVDMVKRGRGKVLVGESLIHSVITENIVRRIRNMYRKGYRVRRIAKLLGLSESNCRAVVSRVTWIHVF